MTETILLTPRQIYLRAYREANKLKIAQKARTYREANKTRMAETQRVWCEANKASEKERKRAYHEANPHATRAFREANPEYRRGWHEANLDKLANYNAKRRAAPGIISPGWIPKLLELQRWTCIVCRKDLRYGYHLDHITPIARGGENTDYNLQALCPTCNLQKNDKDPIEFMQSRGFLL